MKFLPPVPFPAGPYFIKFHPNLSSTIITASQTGQFQVSDIANPYDNIRFFQADISGYLNSMDISSTGEMVAFASTMGSVSIWSAKENSRINAFSRNTEFADRVRPLSNVNISDDRLVKIFHFIMTESLTISEYN